MSIWDYDRVHYIVMKKAANDETVHVHKCTVNCDAKKFISL